MKATRDSLTWFSNTLGPYPYKTVTVVIPPHNAGEAGGMEYPTFFTAEGYEEVQPGTINADLLDFVTVHEFGHGYFYGILANNEFEEPMLDEGLNEYWDQRMMRAAGRQLHPTTPLLKSLGFSPSFKVFEFERASSPREEPSDPLGENAYTRLQGIGPVYSRTAVAMHDLEEQLGKDATERAFREYYKRWKFRHPSVADLRETLAEASGKRQLVERVFAQQVYSTTRVDDRIGGFSSEEVLPQPGFKLTTEKAEEQADKIRKDWKKAHPDAKDGTGPFPYRTEVIVRRRGADVPQTLVVTFVDGSKETVQWSGEQRWQKFEWTKPVKAVSAEIDAERKHLLDANKLDDSRTLKSNGSAARRWAADIAAVIQSLIALIVTV
jgi:hypothetical protein